MSSKIKLSFTGTALTLGLAGMLAVGFAPLASAARQDNNVKKVQQTLKDKGYDPGPVDGAMGPKTRAALGQYQKDSSLPVTQTVDARTAENLGVPEEKARSSRVKSARLEPAGSTFKTAGKDFGSGGKGFGKEIAKGKPIEAGKDLGKGFGAGGENTGKGVAKAVTQQ